MTVYQEPFLVLDQAVLADCAEAHSHSAKMEALVLVPDLGQHQALLDQKLDFDWEAYAKPPGALAGEKVACGQAVAALTAGTHGAEADGPEHLQPVLLYSFLANGLGGIAAFVHIEECRLEPSPLAVVAGVAPKAVAAEVDVQQARLEGESLGAVLAFGHVQLEAEEGEAAVGKDVHESAACGAGVGVAAAEGGVAAGGGVGAYGADEVVAAAGGGVAVGAHETDEVAAAAGGAHEAEVERIGAAQAADELAEDAFAGDAVEYETVQIECVGDEVVEEKAAAADGVGADRAEDEVAVLEDELRDAGNAAELLEGVEVQLAAGQQEEAV